MTINEVLVRFAGKAGIDPSQELELGQDVQYHITGTVVKTGEVDNHDGTKDIVYTIKVTNIK